VPEVVYVQHLMGVDGVIVDLVREIAEAVSAFTSESDENKRGEISSFLLKRIPELVQ
jgi:glycerophosphodiester phosphodiesterase